MTAALPQWLSCQGKANALGSSLSLTIKGYTVASGDEPSWDTLPALPAAGSKLGLDLAWINIYGGGVSIGHPISATGVIWL